MKQSHGAVLQYERISGVSDSEHPISSVQTNELSRRYRSAFDALCSANGCEYTMCLMLQVLQVAALVSEARQRDISGDEFDAAKRGIFRAIGRGLKDGHWYLDAGAIQPVASLIDLHDGQLRDEPAKLFLKAIAKLKDQCFKVSPDLLFNELLVQL